jgi:hypothetical protein
MRLWRSLIIVLTSCCLTHAQGKPHYSEGSDKYASDAIDWLYAMDEGQRSESDIENALAGYFDNLIDQGHPDALLALVYMSFIRWSDDNSYTVWSRTALDRIIADKTRLPEVSARLAVSVTKISPTDRLLLLRLVDYSLCAKPGASVKPNEKAYTTLADILKLLTNDSDVHVRETAQTVAGTCRIRM